MQASELDVKSGFIFDEVNANEVDTSPQADIAQIFFAQDIHLTVGSPYSYSIPFNTIHGRMQPGDAERNIIIIEIENDIVNLGERGKFEITEGYEEAILVQSQMDN